MSSSLIRSFKACTRLSTSFASASTSTQAALPIASRSFSSLLTRPTQTLPSTLLTLHTRSFTSSPTPFTWGGGKLKTHQSSAKRFKPLSKRRRRASRRPLPNSEYDELVPGVSSIADRRQVLMEIAGQGLNASALPSDRARKAVNAGPRPGPLFKRTKAGKNHKNLNVSGVKLNALGKGKVEGQGRLGWTLRKLMPYAR